MPESTTRGALTEAVYYILLSLYQPLHGYAIMQNIADLSAGRVALGAGTLYGALNTLLEKGWILGVGNGLSSRKKEYVISDLGRTAIESEIKRLEELIVHGKMVMGSDSNE
jgi:DNA-binding PadR family transcriptional regulator